jgi:hypothetical protein
VSSGTEVQPSVAKFITGLHAAINSDEQFQTKTWSIARLDQFDVPAVSRSVFSIFGIH